MPEKSTYEPNLVLLLGLVWLVVAAQLLWLYLPQIALTLGDSDDAMRLVEVRAFLAGRGWFDLHEPRLQPPAGYDTHWSRLVDAGLAGLFLILRTFFDAAVCERLMRMIWPLLWLLPAMAGTLALAWRLAGRPAAIVVLLLLLFGLPAFTQFRPGRIDHHDIQITLALLTLAAAIWSDRVSWAAWVAGALSGLALAIGFEGAPFIILAGGIVAVRFALDRDHAPALSRYGTSAAVSTALMFSISIAPGHWTASACDAIAVNTAAPAVLGGIVLAVAGYRFADERSPVRWAAVAVALGLVVAAFAWLEPRCLAGPLAMVDPAVRPIWLAHVKEARSFLAALRKDPFAGLAIASYPIVAAACATVLSRDAQVRRDSGFLGAAAALFVAVAMTVVAVRASAYTIWLGMPFVAAALLRLFDGLKLTSLPTQAIVTLLFTPVLLSLGSVILAEGISSSEKTNGAMQDEPCLETQSYAALAQLPPGRILTDVDYGPFILALTPHSVLAAPYHRLSYGIIDSHLALALPPDKAREILRRTKSTYVMICGLRAPQGLSESETKLSLWTQLSAGNIPSWLEHIPGTSPFNVYRVRP